MPDNPAGVYSLPPSYKVANGDLTDAAQHNPPFEDVEQALTNRVHRDGRSAWTGNHNANGNKLTGLEDGIDPQDAATVGQAAFRIGDFKGSVSDPGSKWLRRDGKLYLRATYPDLAALMPPLPDGVIWESRVSGSASNQSSGLVYAKDRYTAVGGSDVFSSDNGKDWSLRATISGVSMKNIAFGNNVYVAADLATGKSLTSLDGDDWSQGAVINSSGLFGVDYLPGPNVFVAAGGGGYIGSSGDGLSYTARVSGTTETIQRVRCVNGLIIAVGNRGYLSTSTDGVTFTVRPTNTTKDLQDVCFHDGLYVAVGQDGTIITSANLSGWTARTSGVGTTLFTVMASSAGFLASGMAGVARISSNGISWAASPTGTSYIFRGGLIAHDNPSRYLMVGPSQLVLDGLRTLPTQFKVPEDDPVYGFVKALP